MTFDELVSETEETGKATKQTALSAGRRTIKDIALSHADGRPYGAVVRSVLGDMGTVRADQLVNLSDHELEEIIRVGSSTMSVLRGAAKEKAAADATEAGKAGMPS